MNQVLQQWLLNLAIDFPISLSLLPSLLDGSDREPHALNVKVLHGFTLEEAADRLAELAGMGLIEFFHQPGLAEARAIRASEIPSLVQHGGVRKEITFRLTDAGGRAWEAAAEPDWRQMEDGSATPRQGNDRQTGWDWTLFSQDREHLMASLGWWPLLNQREQIDLSSISWELADAYPVKYWKLLPNVHVVSFQSRVVTSSMPPWNHGNPPWWFTAWTNARSNWYRRPWELEGWPPKPERCGGVPTSPDL